MGKKKDDTKDNVIAEVDGIAETAPAEKSVPVTRITTVEQAIELVKNEYTVPKDCKLVTVTEDRNVFWEENHSSAVNHAQKHNLKIFRINGAQ